jgi:hemoglobin/transferrin/lactoferrin receptor protein
MQKSQLGGGSPMMRGFAANSLLIVVDGIRVNNAIFREGNLQNVIMLDPNLIVETDILFGPGSVSYGSDALGGVFAFETKKPQVRNQGEMFYKGNMVLKGSSANRENSWHVDFAYGRRKWAALSSISVFNYNDLKMGSNGPDFYLRPNFVEYNGRVDTLITNPDPKIQYFSAYSQINIAQKFQYKPDSTSQFDFQAVFTTSSPVPRYDRLVQFKNNQPKYANWQYGPQKWLLTSIAYSKMFQSSLADKMRVCASYQQIEESREERFFASPFFLRRTENVDVINLNLDFEKSWNKKQLFYGIEQIFNTVGSKGLSTHIDSNYNSAIASRYPDGSTWQSSAAYAMFKSPIKDQWDLILGTRFNLIKLEADFDNSFYDFSFNKIANQNSALNASIGTVYTPNQNWSFQLNVASGFRAPNIDDLGKIYDSEPGKVIVPNENLKPESVYTVDAGFDFKLKDFGFMVNVYWSHLQDAIQRSTFDLAGKDSLEYNGQLLQIQSLTNVNSAEIKGIEIQAKYRINSIWQIFAAYNLMEGNAEDGSPIRHVTPDFGRAGLSLTQQNYKIQLYAMYQAELTFEQMALSERSKTEIYAPDTNGNPFAPMWYTLNLKGTYSLSQNLQISSGLENILDKRYRPYSSGITAPGLNFYLNIQGTF